MKPSSDFTEKDIENVDLSKIDFMTATANPLHANHDFSLADPACVDVFVTNLFRSIQEKFEREEPFFSMIGMFVTRHHDMSPLRRPGLVSMSLVMPNNCFTIEMQQHLAANARKLALQHEAVGALLVFHQAAPDFGIFVTLEHKHLGRKIWYAPITETEDQFRVEAFGPCAKNFDEVAGSFTRLLPQGWMS